MPYFIIRWTSPNGSPSNPNAVKYSSRIVTADDQDAADALGARYVASLNNGERGQRLTSVSLHSAGAQ